MIIKRTKNAAVASSKEKASTVNKKDPIADDGMNARDFAAFLVMCTRILADESIPVNNNLKPLREEYLKLLAEDGLVLQKK